MTANIVAFPKCNGPAAPLTRPCATSLSFVRDAAPTDRNDRRRCFWAVTPTGDYGEDCRIGHRLAIEYLRFEREDQGGPGALQNIVRDMPREFTGIEIGFLSIIGRAARFGLPEAERLLAFWAAADGRPGP